MKRNLASGLVAGLMLAASAVTAPEAIALECHDAKLTQAIRIAMKREPRAGECNPKLYRDANGATLSERVATVLNRRDATFGNRGPATQKLAGEGNSRGTGAPR